MSADTGRKVATEDTLDRVGWIERSPVLDEPDPADEDRDLASLVERYASPVKPRIDPPVYAPRDTPQVRVLPADPWGRFAIRTNLVRWT